MKTDEYAKIGMNAMLSGMQYIADMINSEVTRIKAEVGLAKWERPAQVIKQRKKKRHTAQKKKLTPYWASMTKRERSEEMKRRVSHRKTNGTITEPVAEPLDKAMEEIRSIEWKNTSTPQA